MKKFVYILCIILLIFSQASCSRAGKTSQVAVDIGKSDKFTEQEIIDAVNCVKEKFKDFKGCTLTRLWYDEEKSDSFVKGYMSNGRGTVNGVKAENVIVLLSDFKVDSSGNEGGFNPNSTYTNWNWVLIRDSKTGGWRVDDWGY